MAYQSKVLRSEDAVPRILIELAKEFKRLGAYEQEGIFRVPGTFSSTIKALSDSVLTPLYLFHRHSRSPPSLLSPSSCVD